MAKPAFLITIDTEGDNLWSYPKEITTNNANWLARFQSVCERFGLIPTYLTNYEMACSPVFREFAQDALRRGTAEIGMHLHAWHSPPSAALTDDDYRFNPYLIEYPDAVMRDKIRFLTDLLESTFNRKMTSHRAGRWAFDGRYAQMLIDCGYTVDCSVTPRVSWRDHRGAPQGSGGVDYTGAPEKAYFIDLNDVCRPGASVLLELPMSIMRCSPAWADAARRLAGKGTLPRRAIDRFFPELTWLRPNGRNLGAMLRLLRCARADGRQYVEFMLHSSELMPGGSPTFTDERSIDALYGDLSELFSAAQGSFRGMGVSDYAAELAQQ
jgi:hypothetical protein